MKKKGLAAVVLGVLLCLSAVTGVAAFADEPSDSPLYTQDFEAYDGTTAVDAWVWNSVGMVCDAADKAMVQEGAIDGWSIRAGGEGSLPNNGLAFRGNTLPFSAAGAYTVSYDIRLDNAVTAGFEVLTSGTDRRIGGILYAVESETVSENKTPHARVQYDETFGIYTFTFDIVTGGGDSWAYFSATFGAGGGHITVDNITVTRSENAYDADLLEPDVSDCIYSQDFSGYVPSAWSSINDWLWNGIQWCSDAPVLGIVTPADGNEAINNESLKIGQSAAGTYSQNQTLYAKGGTLQTGNGKNTLSFDVRLHNVTAFAFDLQKSNTNEPISRISFTPNDAQNTLTSTARNYGVTQENGVYHVYADAVTADSDNWGFFTLTFGEGGGYMVIDNFTVRESTFDYDNMTVFTDDFENYTEGEIPVYLWNNTHLWSDRSEHIAVVNGFDGKALQVGPLAAGEYGAATLFGLKGGGAIVSEENKCYEHGFMFTADGIRKFELVLQVAVPSLGDCPLAKITIDPVNETFTADTAAEVIFGDAITVRLQYKSPGGDIFGAFNATAEEGGIITFDNYTFKTVSKLSIASALYGSDFEDAEFGDFSVETNYYKEEQLLGRITADPDVVINGTYSVMAGFDATNISVDSDKWGKLLELDAAFLQGETYAVTFRFAVQTPAEHYFYVQLGGQSGGYVRFTEDGITEQSADVLSASIEVDGDVRLFTAVMRSPADTRSLLLGTYGGGTIVIDDLYVSAGEIAVPLPAVEKRAPQGEKVFSEGFENQNTGENLSVSSFVSGVDAFGTKYAYGAVNGKISLVIYSGNDWSETLTLKKGILQPNTVYTLLFRYKKLSGEDANVNLIVRGETEKYIAFSTQGKVRAFTTAGGGFYKDIAVASVADAGDCYEVSVTFKTPAGEPVLRLGMFGVAEIAVDDITLFAGGAAQFDGEAQVMAAPDKNALIGKIRNARAVNGNKYTAASYAALQQAVASATAVYNDLEATGDEVTAAETLIAEKTAALVLRGDKTELAALLTAVRALDVTKYTDASVSLLNGALASAQRVAEDEDAVQAEIDTAVSALTAATEALEEKPAPSGNEGNNDTQGGTGKGDSVTPENDGCGCGSSASAASVGAAAVAFAAAALIAVKRKKAVR